ncbi:hypothetical protein [Yoonia sp. BS5-3]|uniref:Uncharacterized protein n=1 Tax=Yoonia phaeophyticola TaxID=3137369 RepID=A0ABZ2V6Y8_9RHOB
MKEILSVVTIVGLSSCGVGQWACELGVDNQIAALERQIYAAEQHLESGYAYVSNEVVRRSVVTPARNEDPDLRAVPCTGTDVDGAIRNFTCFHEVTSQSAPGRKIPLDRAFEMRVLNEARIELRERRASREKDIAECIS